jgi:hypothetical protein
MGIDRPLSEQADNEEIICCQLWMKDADADAIVDVIKKGKVKKMALANNMLGAEACDKIADALIENTSLEWFSIAGNRFGDEGGRHFIRVLENNVTLKSLFLCTNKMSEEVDDELWAVNDRREKPLTENLYGLVLDHASPAARERAEKKKQEEKAKKNPRKAG